MSAVNPISSCSKKEYRIFASQDNKYKYGISFRASFVLNNFINTMDKQITDLTKFKVATKLKLLSLENEVSFF